MCHRRRRRSRIRHTRTISRASSPGFATTGPPLPKRSRRRQPVDRVAPSVEAHFRLGQRLALAKDLAAAALELRAVLERDPDHIDARIDLARTLRLQGKLGDGIIQTRGAFDRSGQSLDIAE